MKTKYLLLLLFSLLMSASGLVSLPPLDRDEPRFTQATRQMVESGDYVDIRFQDASRYQKPVGIYWLQAAAVTLSGEGADAPIWVYRLVSALGIAIAVVAIAWTGTGLFGPSAGIASGLALAAIFAAAFEGRDAKTDAVLLACCVVAQGALARIYLAARRDEAPAGYLPWLFWAAQGAGILIKGPIAPLLSALTVAALFAFERDGRWLTRLKPLRGLALAVLIVLPWLVLITLKSGAAFWQGSVGHDFLAKAVPGEQPHGEPPGYYVVTYSLFMWPFGLIAVGAGLRAINRLRDDVRLRFCLAWYLPFWLVFELIPTKLPHYVLPAYPGLLLLVGWMLTLPREETRVPLRLWQSVLWWATALGLAAVTLGAAAACVYAPIHFSGVFSWWSIPAAAAVLAAGFLAFARGPQLSLPRIGAVAALAGIAYAILCGVIVPSLTPIWMSPRIAAAVRENRPCDHSVLASSDYKEPSLVFLVGTNTLLTDVKGAAASLNADPACAMALVAVGKEAALNALLAGQGRTARRVAEIDGINYSTKKKLALGLYRVAD